MCCWRHLWPITLNQRRSIKVAYSCNYKAPLSAHSIQCKCEAHNRIAGAHKVKSGYRHLIYFWSPHTAPHQRQIKNLFINLLFVDFNSLLWASSAPFIYVRDSHVLLLPIFIHHHQKEFFKEGAKRWKPKIFCNNFYINFFSKKFL